MKEEGQPNTLPFQKSASAFEGFSSREGGELSSSSKSSSWGEIGGGSKKGEAGSPIGGGFEESSRSTNESGDWG